MSYEGYDPHLSPCQSTSSLGHRSHQKVSTAQKLQGKRPHRQEVLIARGIMDFVERFTGGSASQRFRVDTLLKWTDL